MRWYTPREQQEAMAEFHGTSRISGVLGMVDVLLLRSGLGSRAFLSGFWSEPEPPGFGLVRLFSPTPVRFQMTHIEAKCNKIWLRYDLKCIIILLIRA